MAKINEQEVSIEELMEDSEEAGEDAASDKKD